MARGPLPVSELRSITEGEYIIVKFPEDCHWEQAEGQVKDVWEKDNGDKIIRIKNRSDLTAPADGRRTLTFSGAQRGSNNLNVTGVYTR